MRYIAALDVGTTTIRCHIFNENAQTVASATEKVVLLYPKPGYVEIDPEELWTLIIKVIKNALSECQIGAHEIACLGISTQRSTFTSWNLKTGKCYHKFITWKDLRAGSLVEEWNDSVTMKGLRTGARLLHMITRSKRFLAGSVLKLMNTQTTLRLAWVLQNIPELKEAASKGEAVFGGVDCWLLYKFTGKHITDVSNASATGLFDPFVMQWADWAMGLFKLPRSIFPQVVETAGDFGTISKDVFGIEIPLVCSMADQAASLFGSCCFNPGDLKVTMGTGSFVNVNTGNAPHASISGVYPLVAWKIGSELTYVVEGASNDTGIVIDWAKNLGIIQEASETSDLACSVNDSDGVYFVPAFSGLQAPINDQTAAAGFLGIKPNTSKAHIVRSLLESLVFRILLIIESLREETQFEYSKIRVDGGVSNNEFAMQLLADLTGLEVEQAESTEMSVLGVAFVAGLRHGIWKNKNELLKLRKVKRTFKPNDERRAKYQDVVQEWRRAVERLQGWY